MAVRPAAAPPGEHTPQQASAPVWVVGNLTTDLIIHGVDQLPSWGQEVAGSSHRSVAAGQAAYLAFGLRQLDVSVALVGVVGEDVEGDAIRAQLAAAGIDTHAVKRTPLAPTAITVALVRSDGERAFASDFACQRLLDALAIKGHLPHIAGGRALCLVGLFNLPSLHPDDVLPIFERARAGGVPTALDTGWDPAGWPAATVAATRRLLAQTDIFLPNLEEATALTGLDDAREAAIALEADGARIVCVKCAADGAVGRADGQTELVGALPVEVHDAVGAGDSFDAGFMRAHLDGLGLRDCMEFATATAASFVTRSSHRYPTLAEVRAALEGRGSVAAEHPHTGYTKGGA